MKSDDRRPHARRRLAGVVLAVVLLALWGAATHGSLPSGSTEPAIDSVTPGSAAEETVVTITGENFGPSIGAVQGTSGVSFNGVWASPTYWSETDIQVPVPAGAPSGLVTVAVGGEASNGVAFTVERPAPVIEAVDTTFGREGTTVDIIGENFGPSIEASQGTSGVSFNGVWAVPASWSDTEIQVPVPAGAPSGLIVVRSGGHESNGISFTVTGAKTVSRTVVASSAGERTVPEISKLKPDTGQEGESVKIKGSNFGALRGASTVAFNGTAVTDYVSWEDTKIQVRVPEGATTGPVVVTVDGEASSGATFTVTGPVPAINDNGLSPDSGPVGTSVKVKGLNFGASQGESTVIFNGVEAQPTSWSDTKIQVPVPVGATTGPVVVTVDGQASNGVTFTVSPQPQLTLATDLSSVSEPLGTATLTVSVPGGSEPDADLAVTLSHTGTAGEGIDYSVGSLTILAGGTSGTATLTVIDDEVYEGEERIALTAGASGYAASAVRGAAGDAWRIRNRFAADPVQRGGFDQHHDASGQQLRGRERERAKHPPGGRPQRPVGDRDRPVLGCGPGGGAAGDDRLRGDGGGVHGRGQSAVDPLGGDYSLGGPRAAGGFDHGGGESRIRGGAGGVHGVAHGADDRISDRATSNDVNHHPHGQLLANAVLARPEQQDGLHGRARQRGRAGRRHGQVGDRGGRGLRGVGGGGLGRGGLGGERRSGVRGLGGPGRSGGGRVGDGSGQDHQWGDFRGRP